MDLKKLRDDIIVSQHCQRNYDISKEMPQEHIDALIFSVTNCPSKQNLAYYDVIAVTDREVIEAVHELTMDRAGKRTNPQVLGNLMLIFTARDPISNFMDEDGSIKKEERGLRGKKELLATRNAEMREYANGVNKEHAVECFKKDQATALGVAAGYSSLIASQMGYRSGCSSCFNTDKMKDLLKSYGIKAHPLLLMGIGYRDEDRNRREHMLEPGKLIESHVKVPIKVEYI